MRAFRHRDFRVLWIGAFLSFLGSWVQNAAQGWIVYELTHDVAKTAFVSFCSMIPVSIFGPFAGGFVDRYNKRTVLIVTQAVFAVTALSLAVLIQLRMMQYWHILLAALVNGIVSTIEMPARQSVISRVVPAEDLPSAIPLNALTFNLSRLVGPALGALLLSAFGAQWCYGANGISYLALIISALTIRADLTSSLTEKSPIKDLLFEGMLYTFRDPRLRTLFIMESIVSCFGLFYLSLMAPIAKTMLGLGERGYGMVMSSVGIGALVGLLTLTAIASKPYKAQIVGISMAVMGISLALLGYARDLWTAVPLVALVGGAAIMQFNTTNMLFQTLSPERLRGRVIAMHVWALSELAPPGVIFFGWLASATSIPLSLHVGGLCVVIGAVWGYFNRHRLIGVDGEVQPVVTI